MKKEENMSVLIARYLRLAQARRRAVSRRLAELEGTSDRALHEIGISRGDIWAIAHNSSR